MEKRNVVIAVVALSAAFAFGRFSSPEKIKIEKEIVKVEVERKEQTKSVDQNKTTYEIVKPDGTKITKTKVETKKDVETKTDRDTRETITETKLVEGPRSRVTISALAGVNPFNLTQGIAYGGHISRPMLGPITVGAWGLSSGTFGVSLGLQF